MADYPYTIIMGDLNCGADSPEVALLMRRLNLWEPITDESTFPSWRPMKKIDHILVSRSLGIEKARVLNYACSDHLPISLEVLLPEALFPASCQAG